MDESFLFWNVLSEGVVEAEPVVTFKRELILCLK